MLCAELGTDESLVSSDTDVECVEQVPSYLVVDGVAVVPRFVQADATRRRFVDVYPQFTAMVVTSQLKRERNVVLGFFAIGAGVVGDDIAAPYGFNLE